MAIIEQDRKLSTMSGAIVHAVKEVAARIRQKRKREERRDGKDL